MNDLGSSGPNRDHSAIQTAEALLSYHGGSGTTVEFISFDNEGKETSKPFVIDSEDDLPAIVQDVQARNDRGYDVELRVARDRKLGSLIMPHDAPLEPVLPYVAVAFSGERFPWFQRHAEQLDLLPTWAFHGTREANDTVVAVWALSRPVSEAVAEAYVRALERALDATRVRPLHQQRIPIPAMKLYGARSPDRVQVVGMQDFDAPMLEDVSDLRHLAAKLMNPGYVPAPINARPQIASMDLLTSHPFSFRVDGLLPRLGVATVIGPPGCGKSFLVLDLLLSIAAGRPFQSLATTPADVRYYFAEGGAGIGKRIAAWLQERHGAAALPHFTFQPFALDLLKLDIAEFARSLQRDKVRVVAFDPLADSWTGNESAAQDVSLLFRRLREVSRAIDGLVLLVHHTGKKPERGARGSEAFRGGVEVELILKRNKSGIVVQTEKPRDFIAGPPIKLILKPVSVADPLTGAAIGTGVLMRDETSGVERAIDLGGTVAPSREKVPRARKVTVSSRLIKQLELGPARSVELAEAIGAEQGTVRTALNRMRDLIVTKGDDDAWRLLRSADEA